LVLEDFMFLQESIQYQCKYYIKHGKGGENYVLYIINLRIIGHKRRGFIFNKARVFCVALQEDINLSLDKRGIINKKGYLVIETKTEKAKFEGQVNDIKNLWKEMQKFLGYTSDLGALPDEPVTTLSNNATVHVDQTPKDNEEGPVKIVSLQLDIGEVNMNLYPEIRHSLGSR
jgi:hypothetical protein